jgi:1,4-alpha-glucan branching enzyme
MRKLKQPLHQKTKNGRKASFSTTTTIVGEADFVLQCTGAEQVYVCGDFNEWKPASLRMISTSAAGLWEKRLVVPVGRHEYKFVVDGNWVHDPDARENVRNSFGSFNSVLEVQALI